MKRKVTVSMSQKTFDAWNNDPRRGDMTINKFLSLWLEHFAPIPFEKYLEQAKAEMASKKMTFA